MGRDRGSVWPVSFGAVSECLNYSGASPIFDEEHLRHRILLKLGKE